MGKFRVRVNRKGSANIRSGQSASSNASVTTFRDQAKAQRIVSRAPLVAVDEQVEQMGIDEADNLGLETMNIDNNSDVNTELSDGRTVVSRYTNCTNPTFNPVNHIWKNGNQDDVIHLLAFAADTIREREGDQSDVEYYGVLLGALDGIPVEDVKKVYANSYLLHLLFPKVPKELLIKHFDKAKGVLDRKLQVLSTVKDAYGAVKFLLSSLGTLVKAQPISFWNSNEHKSILSDFVGFASHPHPGVRMISRRTLRSILVDENSNYVHPGAKTVAKAVKQQLETSNGNRDTITRLLCLLEGILYKMPDNTLAALLEMLLQFGVSGDSTVRCSSYQCMQRTLEKLHSEENFSIERNAELIIALRSQHFPTDISVLAYWLQALTEAHCCLSLKIPEKSVNLLSETLELFGKAFQISNVDLARAVYLSLNRLISECIKKDPQTAQKCLDVLEKSLNVQNTNIWPHIFESMTALFDCVGSAIEGPVFSKILLILAEMREKDDAVFSKEIDSVIGSAIRNVGLAKVLKVVELGLDPSVPQLPTDFKRSWILPLLSQNVQDESIQFFTSDVLPVLVLLHERLPKLNAVTAKLYLALELQIWDILPNLLESPRDFAESFHALAPVMGSALAQRLDLRLILLRSLRSALKFAERNGFQDTMKKFAKNYLPILFNIYTAAPTETQKIVETQGLTNYDDRAVRLSTLETVRSYILETPEEIRNSFVVSALNKLKDDANSKEKKQAIADLICALIRGLNVEQFSEVFAVVESWFAAEVVTYQKKAYRILCEMYKRINEPALRPFFEKNAPFVQGLIAKGFNGVSNPARGPRIGIYRAILTSFTEYDELKHFADSILEQVILSQDKSFNKTTREQSAHCFLQICSKLIDFGSDADITPSAALEPILVTVAELYKRVPAGAKEVPLEQARSALISLNMLTQKFVKFFNPTVLDKLINLVAETLFDPRNPVKILAIRCMRILCNKLEEFVMSQYKNALLTCIFEQDFTVYTLRVRKAARLLLEVLVDRYGQELLLNATNKDDFVKQIKHIAKIKRRKERHDAGLQPDEADDVDEETASAFTTANTVKADNIFDILEDSDEDDEGKVKSYDKSTFLNEDEDDVVDLLDRETYIQKLSTTGSRTSKIGKHVTIETPKKDGAFRVDKDGKIVIVNIDKKRKRYNSEMFEDDEELEEKEPKDEVAEELKEDMNSVVTSTYRPGGRGIHRETAPSAAMSIISNATTTNGKPKRSDHKKKGDKLEPYAYIPLRNKGRASGLKSILKKKKGGKGKKSK